MYYILLEFSFENFYAISSFNYDHTETLKQNNPRRVVSPLHIIY